MLMDALSKINSLINSNLTKEDSKYFNLKSNDMESTLSAVQSLTSLILVTCMENLTLNDYFRKRINLYTIKKPNLNLHC